jgi:hypothetical protein
MNQDVSDEELDKARHEFLMIQFPELESWSHQIKERSSEENVVNVALDLTDIHSKAYCVERRTACVATHALVRSRNSLAAVLS